MKLHVNFKFWGILIDKVEPAAGSFETIPQ